MNTAANAIFAMAWIIEGVWALSRLVQLGSGSLPDKVVMAWLPLKVFGGFGMVLLLLAFFANISVLLALVSLVKELPPGTEDVAAVLAVYAEGLSNIGVVLGQLPFLDQLSLSTSPYWVALIMVSALLFLGELMMFPAIVAYKIKFKAQQKKAMARVEAKLGVGAGVYTEDSGLEEPAGDPRQRLMR